MDCINCDDTDCTLYKEWMVIRRIKIKFQNDQAGILKIITSSKITTSSSILSGNHKPNVTKSTGNRTIVLTSGLP